MRATIIEAVRDSPGIHFRALQRCAGCSTSTLDYYIDRSDELREADMRGYRRVFTVDEPEDLYSPLAALNHETRGSIIYHLQDEPGIAFAQLADRIDRSPGTVSRHLSVLEDADLIRVEATGRSKRYRNREQVERALRQYGSTILDRLADSFIDAWE